MSPTSIERTEAQIEQAAALQAHLAGDRHRPCYHFMPPAAWMNDINGALFWRGRYHVFYQFNPHGAYWHRIQWGHASSVDLVHWVHHPVALEPDPQGPDRVGCFSGGALVSKEGVPTLIYFGNPDGVCIAESHDDLLINWTRHPDNPVIPQPREGDADFGRYEVHDPCAWLNGDTYYAAVNRRHPQGRGDGAYLFKSEDLRRWQFVDTFYRSRREWTEADEDCAVPDFFPLGDRHVLLFCSHLQATQYYLGELRGERFHPLIHGRMSWEGGQLGGPRTLLDGTGRRIFFDWVREIRGAERERAAGWSGVMTLPRILGLAADGTLTIDPVPDVERLRYHHHRRQSLAVADGADTVVPGIAGDTCELALEIDPGEAAEAGVAVRCSPDGAELTPVTYDARAGVIRVDVSRSSLDPRIVYHRYRTSSNGRALMAALPASERTVTAQQAPFRLGSGEPLTLRVFLDRSLLEVYANGRQCVTQRIYPTRDDAVQVRLLARGGAATVRRLDAWDLAPVHT